MDTIEENRHAKELKIAWHTLFYIAFCYGFHRYIFKYSHGAFARGEYQQTPFSWQVGKFFIISFIMMFIYYRSRFVFVVSKEVIIMYLCVLIVAIVNLVSFFFYRELQTDEIEYLLYAIILIPLTWIVKKDLLLFYDVSDRIFQTLQYILIFSNFYVILNYIIFRVIPFHAYEGVLMRFGSLWDDPNTFAIASVLMAFYAISKKQYALFTLHILDILTTISLNGYILIFVLIVYIIIKSERHKAIGILVSAFAVLLLLILVYVNIDIIEAVYEAKKESIDQHSTFGEFAFFPIPLLNSLVFYETWFISESINYFPFSILFNFFMMFIIFKFFFLYSSSLQRFLYVIFFVTSIFLPFLYMFPVNFVAILLLFLYLKKIYI